MANLDYIKPTPLGQPTSRAVVGLANHLLSEFSIPTIIEDVSDISAALFVVLYESLFSDRLPGIIRQPVTKEDEIYNCQVVIDVLATDVVRDNLNHIRGADIVAGNITSISNLLDIFQCLLEYVVNKIESDIERDDTRSISSVDSESFKPTSTRPPQKKGQISKKKSHSISKTVKSNMTFSNRTNNNGKRIPSKPAKSEHPRPASLNKNENRKAFDDHTIINHEDYFTMTTRALPSQQTGRPPSPIKPDQSQSFLGQKTIDSEFDADLEKVQKQTFISSLGYPKSAWDNQLKQPKEADLVATDSLSLKKQENAPVNGNAGYVTSAPAVHATDSAASRLPSSTSGDVEQPDPFGSTGSLITYHPLPTADKPFTEKTSEIKGLSSSYSDLRQLVEKTAALTRVALATSPIRHKDVDYLDITDVTRDRPPKSKAVKLANTGDAVIRIPTNKENVPSKATKRVVFASQSDVGIQDRLSERNYLHPSKSAHRANGYHSSTEVYTTSGFHRYNGRASDYVYSDLDREGRYPLADASPSHKLVTQKKPATTKPKRQTLAKHLAANRQPELGAALMTLTNEDKALRQKQQILRKFYEKDHEDFTEDVEYMIGRDVQQADEVVRPYGRKLFILMLTSITFILQLLLTGKLSSYKKGKVSSKSYQKSTGGKTFVSSTPTLTIENEEDLLPTMLEEFPHLHLSGHTWHELWRKSLHQIEALTRTYLASQRKKSNAQTQLEEAGGKHQLLSDLMKDQLEHHRRLQEIKQQKQQQIRVRNKVNEKRIQSARARCYYNEYQVRARAKQLKRRTKEEMVFRELFKDALNIQKERIQDIRRYANDLRKRQEMTRQNQIDSIENFYNDQFAMLAERLAKERLETGLRESAQQKLLERMKRELRKKMEEEIKQYQEQIFHDDDDVHFRQVDADRLRKHLHHARYSCKI
ncbi:unnamed protein product [Lymnaea stagnalis]|uniref:DUF5745 domain-containing protein n=1 Tax=Lymnaea stagnalis TaxID=6523 RepID=A0AAV2I1L0_LYMST